jgi:hypothetical protein
LAQVPAGTVKSVVSLFVKGEAPKLTEPAFAVTVIVPVPQVVLVPAPVLPQANDVGLTEAVPKGVPVTVNTVPTPVLGLTVMVASLVPVLFGEKVSVTVQV